MRRGYHRGHTMGFMGIPATLPQDTASTATGPWPRPAEPAPLNYEPRVDVRGGFAAQLGYASRGGVAGSQQTPGAG